MRVLLIIAGIVLIIAGFVLPIVTSFMPNSFSSAILNATDGEARAAELCREGETLETAQGASEYTPGTGYGRPTQYYCVNGAGVRRDVTGAFVGNMFDDVLGAIPSLLPNAGFMLLPVLGVILLIWGILLGARKRTRQFSTISRALTGGGTAQTFSVSKSNADVNLSDFVDLFQQLKTQHEEGGNALAARLQQLEEARKKNLISQEEYEALRKQALKDLI